MISLRKGSSSPSHESWLLACVRFTRLVSSIGTLRVCSFGCRNLTQLLTPLVAANILIHEEGRLQICDFGVAGVLQSHVDKRSTWIGTPHWMPPEMFSTRGEAHKYGSEVRLSFLLSPLRMLNKTRSMCGHMAALSSNSQRETPQTPIYGSGCKLEGNSTVPHRVLQMKITVKALKT